MGFSNSNHCVSGYSWAIPPLVPVSCYEYSKTFMFYKCVEMVNGIVKLVVKIRGVSRILGMGVLKLIINNS